MRKNRIAVGSSLFLVVCLSGLLWAEDKFKSGLQPGESIPNAFEPLNVTGDHAGEKYCLICENGLSPVVMIFAREVSDPLTRLITKTDAATAKHHASTMGSFVVFLSNQKDLDKQLREVGKKNALKHIVLSIDEPAGPEGYKVSKDADLTVVLYNQHVVKANHAFKKGELTDKAIDQIVADLPKIFAKK